MLFGILFIVIGALWLFKNLGLIVLPASLWQVFWPLLFIVIGIYAIMGAHKGRRMRQWFMGKRWGKIDEEGK